VPILPELARALQSHLARLRRRYVLTPDLPLFLSRKSNPDGTARAITREAARQVIRGAFAQAGILDDGRLGTHSLRKTYARSVYEHSGHDLMVLKSALGHSDISITQQYLEVDEDRVAAAIAKVDFTRRPRKPAPLAAPVAVPAAPVLPAAA
jgi:integrase